MVYYADGIPRAEALVAHKMLAALLIYKLKQEYSEMCRFVRAKMSLAIVRLNSPLLRGPRGKGAHIRQGPEMKDWAVIALFTPWCG